MTPRSRSRSLAAAVLAVLLIPRGVPAEEIDVVIERHTLPNGLRVVLAPDASVPTVGVAIDFDVGSFVEAPGRTGFAHLFEHMMFQGTTHVGKAEHFRIVAEAGGHANGSTGQDLTRYYEVAPSNALDLMLWLELDRLANLDLTPSNFENQRSTVMREREERIDNQPYYGSFLRINELAYGDYFAYAHSVIGEMEDLRTMPFEAAAEFFRTYYAPDNAVLAVAGDFDPPAALALVERFFGTLPPSGVASPTFPPAAPQEAERVETMEDPLAPLPAFHVAWHVPPGPDPAFYAFEILATWLADGETAPLYREIVKERTLAQQFSLSVDGRRGPDLLTVWAVVAEGHTGEEVRAVVYDRLERVAADGIPEEALARARIRTRARFLSSIQSNLRLALRLAEYELRHDDAGFLLTELDRYDAVTSEDVRRAVIDWIRPENRTVLDVIPATE